MLARSSSMDLIQGESLDYGKFIRASFKFLSSDELFPVSSRFIIKFFKILITLSHKLYEKQANSELLKSHQIASLPFSSQYIQIYYYMKSITNPFKPFLITLFIALQGLALNDPKICDGNHFKFISTYALGRQNDLTLTFGELQPLVHVDKVIYKDQLYRTYTIQAFKLSLSYMESKQTAQVDSVHRLKISGGTLKISYEFDWQKKQLSSSIKGTGKGTVTTDSITFVKSLDINTETKQLEWNFVSAEPIKITNSLTINDFKPYKVADYDVINEMLNHLKEGGTTVKDNLVKGLNLNFTAILKKIVHENNDTWKEPQSISYSYSDYRGDFNIKYDNFIVSHSLKDGLDLLLSRTTQNDSKFQCGEKVPDEPDDESVFGGLQEFVSNSFLKSTLRYAINKGFLDVILTEQFWQSPAFQFYAGDLHEVMPSTRNISSLVPINGKCKALDDHHLALTMKSMTTYDVKVNFTCWFEFENKTKILDMNLAVDYEVKPEVLTDHVDFVIKGITGTPTYIQYQNYKIKNMDLANFMVAETLNMARNNKVLGSGFKVMGRKFPGYQVRNSSLFMFDTSSKPHGIAREQSKVQFQEF